MPMPKNLRILFLGESWFGSCARACSYALRRMGHDVQDVSNDHYTPQWRRRISRAAIRVLRPIIEAEYNAQVLQLATTFRPHLLLAFKAPLLRGSTLRTLREQGVILVNYYPDPTFFAYGHLIPEAIPEYDCIFSTKPFLLDEAKENQLVIRDFQYLPHGYDPEIHRPEESDQLLQSQVCFIGSQHDKKELLLDSLLEILPSIDLKIWGDRWGERGKSKRVLAKWQNRGLFGSEYARAISNAKISLALLSGQIGIGKYADQTTTRTFEIPACGGFMLHERNAEVLELFSEGSEVECFLNAEELAAKISFYLSNESARLRIAERGYSRCVPSYSYDERMKTIVEYAGNSGLKT
jgi:spore maturation protein CgeB